MSNEYKEKWGKRGCSSAVERLVANEKVACSNHVTRFPLF